MVLNKITDRQAAAVDDRIHTFKIDIVFMGYTKQVVPFVALYCFEEISLRVLEVNFDAVQTV